MDLANSIRPGALLLASLIALSGCGDTELPKFNFPKFGKSASADSANDTVDDTVRLVERDVEAPNVFQVTDTGLWDGRPSLGGVWVAFPGDIQPERVIIRNEENKKFVIGALFKRERENPGPKVQLSSDAAAALGILAGKPTMLNITALRRESVPETDAATTTEAPRSIGEIAATAIDESDGVAAAPAQATPAAAPARAASTLAKPFIQIGIFSVETNARNTATSMRTQGIVPVVKEHSTKGKKFWRVIIGPASSSSERAALLKKAKGLGFTDAYFVTN